MDNPTVIVINGDEIKNNDIIVHVKQTGKYKDSLQELLQERVLNQFAQKNKLSVTDDELQDYVNEKRNKLGLMTVDSIDQYLAGFGISTDQWVDSLEIELVREKVKNAVATKERIQQYFNENKGKYIEIFLFKIVVDNKDKCEEVLMEVRDDGDSFKTASEKYNSDDELIAKGGFYKKVKRGELDLKLENRIFTSQEKAVIDPIEESENKFALYYVNKIVEPELTDDISKEIKESMFSLWLSQMVQSSHIEIPKNENETKHL